MSDACGLQEEVWWTPDLRVGDVVRVLGQKMCAAHTGQQGSIMAGVARFNHAHELMRPVLLTPNADGLLGVLVWIEVSELVLVDQDEAFARYMAGFEQAQNGGEGLYQI